MSNLQVHLHSKDISTLQGQTVVFFAKPNAKKDQPAVITEKDVNDIFEESLADKIITGAANEAVTFREANLNNFRHVIIVGLGADAKMTGETIRQSAAALYKEIKATKVTEAFIQLDGLTAGKKDLSAYTQALEEGLHLAS